MSSCNTLKQRLTEVICVLQKAYRWLWEILATLREKLNPSILDEPSPKVTQRSDIVPTSQQEGVPHTFVRCPSCGQPLPRRRSISPLGCRPPWVILNQAFFLCWSMTQTGFHLCFFWCVVWDTFSYICGYYCRLTCTPGKMLLQYFYTKYLIG